MAVHLGTKCAAGAALLGSSRAAAEQWICTACPHCTAKPTSVHRSHEVSFFCLATRTTWLKYFQMCYPSALRRLNSILHHQTANERLMAVTDLPSLVRLSHFSSIKSHFMVCEYYLLSIYL